MSTMLETTENAINHESETGIEIQSITTQSDDCTIENQLTDEINTLWGSHVRLSADRKTTTRELRQIRASLAERLYAMKSLLSRPGRGGQWRSWLKERGIPRSSADRLALRHGETLNTANNVPTGAIPEPNWDEVGRFFDSLWSRLDKKLPTPKSAYNFLMWFVGSFDLPYEMQKNGILVLAPTLNSLKESSNAAATLVDGQPIAAADASSGHVV